ncbi:MAG TPA: DedA family protein [Firmicutes bacterium]|nr:DedA family protein [Bacillota bacterium]
MHEVVVDIINRYGYIGILLLITLENVFPPIPSEVILTFGGFVTTYTSLRVWGVVVAATVGSVLGAVILYGVGRLMNAERLGRLLDGRWGKVLRLKKDDVLKAEEWFLRHGNLAVFLCRFVPIVRSLISLPAGMSKMPPRSFLILTIIGTSIWNVVLVLLGRLARNAWEIIVEYLDIYSLIVLVLVGVVGMVVVVRFLKRRFSDL